MSFPAVDVSELMYQRYVMLIHFKCIGGTVTGTSEQPIVIFDT